MTQAFDGIRFRTPQCEDLDHYDDDPDEAKNPAVAMLPLFSPGMLQPYSWMPACAPCRDAWARDPYNDGRPYLMLTATLR